MSVLLPDFLLTREIIFQYLIKANEIKTKKGVDLLQHLVDYYHAQNTSVPFLVCFICQFVANSRQNVAILRSEK